MRDEEEERGVGSCRCAAQPLTKRSRPAVHHSPHSADTYTNRREDNDGAGPSTWLVKRQGAHGV
eukprot:363925-Chlamydomonas_euryale.AAC.13